MGDEIPDAQASHGRETAPSRISSLAINGSFGTPPDLESVPHLLTPAF